MTNKPPMEVSDEAKQKQLDLAREQGRAYEQALLEMTKHEAHGREQQVGDYLVGFAVEQAEGMYRPVDGHLEWQEPQRENAHIEVAVRDASDGRFVPGLQVRLTVESEDGTEIGTHEQPFLWHPWLYHYGRNWELPGDGTYNLKIQVEPPQFGRHDKKNGQRFGEAVETRFDGVEVKTGQK